MDFCQKCGFLLPVGFTGDKPICGPCQASLTDARKRCTCEMCNYAGGFIETEMSTTDNGHITNDHTNSTINAHTNTDDGAIQTQKKKRTKSKQKQDSNISKQPSNPPISNEHHADTITDWSNSGLDDWGNGNDNCGWDAPAHTQPEWNNWNDNNDPAPTKPECNDWSAPGDQQSQITSKSDNVEADWEMQQLEYKKWLIMNDTLEIASLVSGERRKTGKKRYHIGGVDISFIKDNNVDACACLTVIRMPDLKVMYQSMQMIKLTQPYIPGFLAFREVPPLLELFQKLEKSAPQYKPDVVMVDGNGILHPRGFGLASHLGMMLNIPTMGVAKSLMSAQGICEDANHKRRKQVLQEAGDGFDLISNTGQVLGKCLRVHDKAPNPVYISVGHKISLESAVWLALECCEFRIPEPVRRADLDSREYIRQNKSQPVEIIN